MQNLGKVKILIEYIKLIGIFIDICMVLYFVNKLFSYIYHVLGTIIHYINILFHLFISLLK